MSQTVDIKELNEKIEQQSAFVQTIFTGMENIIVGQKHLVESLLIGLLWTYSIGRCSRISKNACYKNSRSID